jgi:hypothetical protein
VSQTDDAVPVAEDDTRAEVVRLSEELRLCRLELAAAREAQETALEQQSRVRRAKARAEKDAEVMSKALADVLFKRTQEEAARPWWRRSRREVATDELDQVVLLRTSKLFRPAWYLRENPDVARAGIDPAVHFLREGHREGRDPGPRFDMKKYLARHPELHETGENPLLHFLRAEGEAPRRPGKA